ncbi:transcriptional regulator [Bifidobacterium animalis subsp. lactis]|nr:transcriptional regulator [Bifidobacterium animalis subsp. lactis]
MDTVVGVSAPLRPRHRRDELCLEGEASIPQRREILAEKREELQHRLQDIEDSIAYIDAKEQFYEAVLDGTTPYVSNVLGLEE